MIETLGKMYLKCNVSLAHVPFVCMERGQSKMFGFTFQDMYGTLGTDPICTIM